MPLFSHREPSPPPPEPAPPAHRGSSLFHKSKRTPSPQSSVRTNTTSTTASSQSTSKGYSLLHRNHGEDPSIVAAREQVIKAEQAERDADKSLQRARTFVREARERVKKLEEDAINAGRLAKIKQAEAEEEARLAAHKQKQAQDIGARGRLLGRHDHH